MVAETVQEPIVQYLTEKVTNISESGVGKAIKKNVESVPLLDSSVKLLSQKCDGTIQYLGELSSVLRETTGGARDQLWVYVTKAKAVRDEIPTEQIQKYIEKFNVNDVYETSKSYVPIESTISFLDHDKDGTVSCNDIVAHGQDFSNWVVAKSQDYYPQALVELLLAYFMPLYVRFQEIELLQKFLSMSFVSSVINFLTSYPASYYASLQVWWYLHVPNESLKTPVSSIFSFALWKSQGLRLLYRDDELISFITECARVFTGYSIWHPFIMGLWSKDEKPEDFDSDSDEFKEN